MVAKLSMCINLMEFALLRGNKMFIEGRQDGKKNCRDDISRYKKMSLLWS